MNEKGVLLWDKIYKLQKGQIYKQVSRDPSVFLVAVLCDQLYDVTADIHWGSLCVRQSPGGSAWIDCL